MRALALHVHGGALNRATAGALHPRRAAITAVLTALAVMLYFTVKITLTVWTAALNVALVVYKPVWMCDEELVAATLLYVHSRDAVRETHLPLRKFPRRAQPRYGLRKDT